MTRSSRRTLAATSLLSMMLVSCGAKTGLRVPCEMPLRGTRPAFVLVYEKSNGSIREQPQDDLPHGRELDQEQRTWARSFFASMGTNVLIGATPWPVEDRGTPRFLCPWSDTLLSPIADDGGASAMRYMDQEWFVARPNGPISQSIEAAVRALRTLPEDVHPRVVILTMMTNVNGCFGDDGRASGPRDWHYQRVARFRDEGFPTLVVGVRQHGDGSALNLPTVGPYAIAGGLARTDGPALWYDFTLDRDALLLAAERAILHPAYCVLRAQEGTDEPDGWLMTSLSAGMIPRDSTHQNGWDWVDASAGTVQLYGAHCDRVARARERPRLVTRAWGCYPPP